MATDQTGKPLAATEKLRKLFGGKVAESLLKEALGRAVFGGVPNSLLGDGSSDPRIDAMRYDIAAQKAQINQHAMQQADNQSMTGYTQAIGHSARPASAPYSRDSITSRPLHRKAQMAMDRLAEQLPMCVAAKISELHLRSTFYPVSNTEDTWRYVVAFIGGRVIEFPVVADFPTDADVARICLECP